MATKNKTALSTMAETLVNSQGGKVKHVPAPKPEPVSLTDLEILDLVGKAGAQVISYAGADEVKVKALAEFNTVGKSLHSAGVVIADGRSKDKQTAVIKKAFLDSMPNLSKGYAQNCYELFAKLVNSGKEIKDFNKSKNKAKNGETVEALFENVLAKVYSHSEYSTMPEEFQNMLEDKLTELGFELS